MTESPYPTRADMISALSWAEDMEHGRWGSQRAEEVLDAYDERSLAALGAISRAINEAIGRSMLLDPALRDLLIRTGNALDDVINNLEGVPDDV